MSTVLDKPPALLPLLLGGAVRSLRKRPSPGAPYARTRLVLRDARADESRLSAYSRLCAFPAPAATLPLPYLHVLAFPLAMRLLGARDFPLPLPGLVHTSIEIVRHAALPVAGSYELTVYVSRLAPHRRGTEATVVTEARLAGKPVWDSRSTYLSRHRTADEGTPASPPEQAGPLPCRQEWEVPGNLGRAYASVSGDRNPIHLTALTARLFGFRRAIAHGMWTAARCVAAYGEVSDGSLVRVEFRTPVPLPGVVRYGSEGRGFELRGAGDRLHLSGTVSEAP
ncbi:MaoC family dehydratase [Streptomyces sp. MB22_4]|uniref:MaoC family dehydratase n=1 Tax=Streptomyces sp. MB22_4 TaxID=3383120 RepID=UPI00399FB39A